MVFRTFQQSSHPNLMQSRHGASDFAETNTCSTSVAAGASCFITVTFKPLAAGARTAAVSVSDNGGGSPQKVTLAGTRT